MWTIDTPQKAFEFGYLLNELLAVSALHLHYTRVPDDKRLFTAVRTFFDRSIRSYQNALEHVDSSNAEAVVLNAILLAIFAGPVSRTTRFGNSDETYELPLFSMHLNNALYSLQEKAYRQLDDSNVKACCNEWGASGMDNLPRMRFLQLEEKTCLSLLLEGLDPTLF